MSGTQQAFTEMDERVESLRRELATIDCQRRQVIEEFNAKVEQIDRLARELTEVRRERDAAIADKDSIFESFTKMSATNEQTFQNWRKSVARAEQLRLHMFGHTAECNECRRLLGIDRAAQQRQTKKSIVDYIHERWGPVMQRLADGDDKPTDQ